MHVLEAISTDLRLSLAEELDDVSIVIEGRGDFKVDHLAMALLDRDGKCWRALFYSIRENPPPRFPFDPSWVTCVHMDEDKLGGWELWPPPPRRKCAKRKRRAADEAKIGDEDADGEHHDPIGSCGRS